MKAIILCVISCILQLNIKSQNKPISSPPSSKYEFMYLVGSARIPGYEMATRTTSIQMSSLSSAVAAPILQVYVLNKRKFIAGILENEKGEKTTIKNMTVVTIGKNVFFNVDGKAFSRGFEINDGIILQEDSLSSVFYTDKVGVWKITKK